jgi:hypothetical protein
MTKREKNIFNKHYRHYRAKMGIRWFGMFKKMKPIEEYGFWIDSVGSEDRMFIPNKIPYDYVIDIFCDLVAKSKLHAGNSWNTSFPEEYYNNVFKNRLSLQKDSEILLSKLLEILACKPREKSFFIWYKQLSRLMKAIY